MADPLRVGDDPLAQLRRSRDRLAALELRAIAAAEYDHALNLRRAGAALDNVLDAVGEESR